MTTKKCPWCNAYVNKYSHECPGMKQENNTSEKQREEADPSKNPERDPEPASTQFSTKNPQYSQTRETW